MSEPRRLTFGDGAPAVSVVVPTLPDADYERTVTELREQALDRPYEVLLVVDDTVGRSAARNLGVEAADAPLVAFTDDDCRPDRNWLARILERFDADAELVCLEGAVYGGARYRGTRRYLTTNLAVRREVALDVGGFDESLHWREDTEFGWRVERDADGRCVFDPDVRVCHPTVPRTRPDLDCERRLREAHPERYAELVGEGVLMRLRLHARRAGLTPGLGVAYNAVRRLLGRHPCPP